MLAQEGKELLARIGKFCTPSNKIASLELGATLGLFAALFGLILYGYVNGYWITYLVLPVAAILTTRMFTIQHDCGHGSYFKSPLANTIAGNLLGILTLTPYYYWRKTHTVHHAFSGNLDKRGTGDVDTFTIDEYKALPAWKQLRYRIYRNPFFMLIIAPFFLFGIKHRLPLDNPFHSVKTWASVIFTNLGIVALVATLVHFFGWGAFFFVYVPVLWLGCTISVGGFYIQHQYEDAYWHDAKEWSYYDAGLKGSSYFEFPAVINWLVNNINLHHIHHLNGHVPSYRLRSCLNSIPELQAVPKRTLADVAPCFTLALWDTANNKMVGFNAV